MFKTRKNKPTFLSSWVAALLLSTAALVILEMNAAAATSEPACKISKWQWVDFATGQKTGPTTMAVLRLCTDDGNDGFCVMLRDTESLAGNWLKNPQAKAHISAVLDSIIGKDVGDPSAIKVLWEDLHQQKVSNQLLMAIDLSLWDRYGRANKKPVADLIGKKREKVAAHLATLWPPLPPFNECKNQQDVIDEFVKLARETKKRGLRGFKIHPYINGTWNPLEWRPLKPHERGAFPDQDLMIVKAVYAELGNSIPLMFDPGFQYNLKEAIRVGQVLDEMKFTWYEDPLPEWGDLDYLMKDWVALRKTVKTPLMGPQEFIDYHARIRWLEAGAADWARLDVCYGGLTPCLELIKYCQKTGRQIDLHSMPMNDYMYACYPVADDVTMPWLELTTCPWWVPVATTFPGSAPAGKAQPWFKRVPVAPVDADGYAHLNFDIPGIGPEVDWNWIESHQVTDAN